jgi:hypothetical protein
MTIFDPFNWECAKASSDGGFCFYRSHLALAAFCAIRFFSSGDNFAALAFPPLDPPSFPRATAAGFFILTGSGN